VKSPHGDFIVPAKFVKQPDVRPEYDLVLLTCKAYDLDAAIASIRPAMGPSTHVLPLLNGLAHVDRLIAEFGAARVIALKGPCQNYHNEIKSNKSYAVLPHIDKKNEIK